MREGYGTWSVCVCVCVCLSVRHHESCHYAQWNVQQKVPTASAQSEKHFKYGVALFKSYGVKTLYVLTAQCLTATSYARAQAFENAHALTTMCEYTEGCGAKTEIRTAVYNVD